MNHLNPEQAERLKEIGAHLRQIRQELPISLEEVAAKTFIRSTLLKAIEEGQSDQLPEPVFIQGFIRRYGDVLGLDGAALAKTFPTIILPVESDTSSQDLPASHSKSIPVSITSPVKYDTSSQNLPKLRFKSIPLYVPCIVLVVAIASGLLYLLNRQLASESVVKRQNSPIAQQQQTVAKSVPVVPAKPKAQSSLPIQVTVNLKEKSWMRVIVDGRTQFEGVLPKGKRQTWTAKKKLTLRAGNAGAVSISFNRGEPKLLGSLGGVKEVTFTPNN